MILDQINSALGLGQNVTLISDIFRALFFFIDGFIYSLIPTVYGLIYSLYDFSKIFKEGVLNNVLSNMTSTVYSFLAIFMFFRVAFSLITMLVDPSVIDDKERGAKKIVANIMICLILIVAVPYAFKYAKMIQTRVIDNHLIEKIVTGREFTDDDYDLGNEMALSVWSVFFRPSGSGDPAVDAYNAVFSGGSSEWNLSAILEEINNVSGGGIFGRYDGAHYCLSYVYILSTIAGIYVLWMFVKVMVDVAYRSIKFFVLELLSPIAIVSYIDPSSSKKGIFSKWLNETVKTYIGLFVRLFVFAFASVLLRTFSMSDLTGGDDLFVNLFYILAIIAFIKNGPGFIDNLFGTSISKEKESTLAKGMKSVLGFGGLAAGAAAGGIANAVVAKKAGKNGWQSTWAGVKGTFSGGKKGYAAGVKGGIGGATGAFMNAYGSYGDAKKKYGYDYDSEFEKLVSKLQQRVSDVNAAKGAAAGQMEMGGQGFIDKLTQGAKVNGRKYGRGLENDEGLENLLKKNAGGLAQDELLHQGDDKYLTLRRLVAKAKDDDAILSRVSSKARSQYSSAESAFNSSDDKNAYVVSFEMGTAQMDYGRMDEKELQESFNKELLKTESSAKVIQSERQRFNMASREQKVNLVLNNSGGSLDRSVVVNMSDETLSSEYERLVNQAIEKQSDIAKRFNEATSQDDKIKIALELKKSNIEYEVSSLSGADLTDRFDTANEKRIVATFGQSITNIDNDTGKASGDAKKAQEELDRYLKSGPGKKAKNIDSAYSVADTRQKAKELEENRKKEQQNNRS